MNNEQVNCIICQTVASSPSNSNDSLFFNCPKCGKFYVSKTFAGCSLDSIKEKHYIISAILRERDDRNLKTVLTSSTNADENFFTLEELLSATNIPSSPTEKALKFLSYMKKSSKDKFGRQLSYNNPNHYVLAYAQDENEFHSILELLEELGDIKKYPGKTDNSFSVTAQGWDKIDQLEKENPQSTQGFIAMWFGGYKKGEDNKNHEQITKKDRDLCYKAIKDAFIGTAFEPLRVDGQDHNNKICDQIIIDINQSKFLIADVTGNRGGVYFEAGYAKAKGMEVIWLCKKDYEPDIHFDTRNYNYIRYSDYSDLTGRLRKRIQATVSEG